MDRGRMIDNIQNTNARFIDNYGSNHRTSIKMINPPGGRSSFSLGWGFEEPKKNSTPIMSRNNNMVNNNSQLNNTGYGMNYQQYNNNVYNNDRSTYGQRVMETTNYQANNYNFQQTVPNQFSNGNNYQLNNGNMKNENTIREVIGTLSKITGKNISKEKEDRIIETILKDKVPKSIDKMF